jgi:L-amino acid N-acyltransferase YncA
VRCRPAGPGDAPAIAEIYNQGIAERIATFETEPRTPADILGWLQGDIPVVVVQTTSGETVAWASAQP